MVEQVRMLDCQGWWAEKEAPLGGGIGKGSLGDAEAATGSYRGGCGGVAEERPQLGRGL